ncbi:hypothetical protein CL617_01290 [archaeon]|nr:hypothetical protein [archaeon]|tara:strand:+ start:5106 stop:5648 length:543 start_codon:yes stop_codon:yes gene_type:complete
MNLKIEDELKKLPKDFIVLTIVPSEHYSETNLKLLDFLIKKGNGTYITINKPYNSLIKNLKEKGLSLDNLYFIDCITKELRESTLGENCSFIESPQDLTGVAIALDSIFKKDDHNFIYLDSIDTLGIYNDSEKLIKFFHFLTGKIKLHNLSGAIIGVHEETDKKVISKLTQFCDKVIDLT